MKKVCVVTATRAEYGLLRPLMDNIKKDEDLKLQLVVTGMHLVQEFGYTYREIEKDGYKIDEKIEVLMNSDTKLGMAKTMGLAMISFSEVFTRIEPDIVVILGDRYEMLAIASTAMILNIPIAHIHGGELTEGAIDDAIRHSITKMSYLHFTSTEEYRRRVIQLGESPDRVYNVGALGVESINKLKLLDKKTLEERLDFKFNKKVALFTYHSVTLENTDVDDEIKDILEAIDMIEDLKIIFTKANADSGGKIINKNIEEYVKKHPDKSILIDSMGQLKYLSAMKYVDIVVGNSSSGILETPSFKLPTINIGDRQKGRIHSENILNTSLDKKEIHEAIKRCLNDEFKILLQNMKNPYGDGNTSEKIVEKLKTFLLIKKDNIKKEFFIK